MLTDQSSSPFASESNNKIPDELMYTIQSTKTSIKFSEIFRNIFF